MLRIDGLNQYYRQSRTLWDIGLEVPAGSLLCLMGRNGVGKTTLLKCIMGPVSYTHLDVYKRQIARTASRVDRALEPWLVSLAPD